eukprot:TRINITY_DN64644_c0_g1_i1.p1 TRINITY_DN64644_c0_g1~~TRINITY_DN64644_c0_g1_i1.p1  ORF type:complete len:421 (+),score=25.65 TRINITY_DN64644_c0_g1_i1:365-1627(+)
MVALADGEEAKPGRFRRGARIMAAKKAVSTTGVTAYRFAQAWSWSYTCVGLLTYIVPYDAGLVLLTVYGFPVLVFSGLAAFSNPTWFVAPPGTSVSGLMDVKCSGCALMTWLPLMGLLLNFLCLMGYAKAAEWHVHLPYPIARLLATLSNEHALTFWTLQGSTGGLFAKIATIIAAISGVVYVVWTPCILVNLLCSRQDTRQVAHDLSQKIEEAAEARLKAAVGVDAGGSFLREVPNQASLPAFPVGVEPGVALVFPISLGVQSYRKGCVPGGFLLELALMLLDVLTDMYSIVKLLANGHYIFGFCIATFTYTSTIVQWRRGLWKRLWKATQESSVAGVATDDLLDFKDSERGVEALPAFLVQLYAMPYMGLRTPFQVGTVTLSILLSLRGLVSHIVETVDLDFGRGDTTEHHYDALIQA